MLVYGNGFFGPSAELSCQRGTGEVGQRCGSLSETTSGIPQCVPGSRCVYPYSNVLAESPMGDAGNNYWLSPRVAFSFTSSYQDDVCVADGSLGEGGFCASNESCAAGLLCHSGYEPHQCRPRSEPGGPCLRSEECRAGGCLIPDTVAPYTFGSNQCALADPGCDIRVDATCDHWLGCGHCLASTD